MSENLMIDLFREKIVPSDLGLLKSLKVYGLECIVRLFVLVNEIAGNVLDLDPHKNVAQGSLWPSSSVGQDSENNSGNKPKFNRFRINIMPEKLEGIRILWSLLGAHDQSNQYLFHMV